MSKQTGRNLAIEANVMNAQFRDREIVFTTPWFQILAEPATGGGQPHYLIQGTDFVVIVAVTPEERILLVRQFRVPVAAVTLELPAGHVDPGESPEQAARRGAAGGDGLRSGYLQAASDSFPIRCAVH